MAAAVANIITPNSAASSLHDKIFYLFETYDDSNSNNDPNIDFSNPELNRRALEIIQTEFATFEARGQPEFNDFKVHVMGYVFYYICLRQLLPSLNYLLSKIENINNYIKTEKYNGVVIRLTPLAQICGTQNNLIVYNILVERGATLYPVDAVEDEKNMINKYLLNNSTLTMYNEVFKSKDIVSKFIDLFNSTSPYMKSDELKLFFETHRLFEDYEDIFNIGLAYSQNHATKSLVEIYNNKSLFRALGTLPSTDTVEAGLMFSQKGYTCVQDAIFTFLFENDILAPFWRGIIPVKNSSADSCPLLPTTGDSHLLEKYRKSFESAMTRYERFKSISAKNVTTRRKLSVNNSVWKNTYDTLLHNNISSTNRIYKGLNVRDINYLFDNVINKNIFKIEGLSRVSSISIPGPRYRELSSLLTYDKVIGCVCVIMPLHEYKFGKRLGHTISIFKKGSNWYLADNEVGFLHKFPDSIWVRERLLRRIITSITQFDETINNISAKFLDNSVYFIQDKTLHTHYLNGQFVCIDEKNYPDIPINPKTFKNNKWFFYSAVFIFDNGTSVSGTVTGGGSAAATGGGSAAATVGGYRRKTGRRLRKQRSNKKTRRNMGGGKTH